MSEEVDGHALAGDLRIYFLFGEWDDQDCAPIKARWLELDDAFDSLEYDVGEHRPGLAGLVQLVRDAAQNLVDGRA